MSFINDISSKIILPPLPLFIKAIGGTGIAFGLVGGIGEAVASVFKIVSGNLSDKFRKRKPFVLLFFVYGLFFALVDATQRAFASDLSNPEIRGTALSTFQSFTGLAALPSGAIAGILWDSVGSQATFAFGATVSLIAGFLFWVFSSKKLV